MPTVSNKVNWNTDAVSFYKFVCKNPEITFVYVGHTTNFRKRKSDHKSDCCNLNSKRHNTPVYQFIRANGGWENWTMIEIKSQICLSHRDAERVEQDLINQEHQVLNAHKAHNGLEKICCVKCNKTFTRTNDLKRHNERKIACDLYINQTDNVVIQPTLIENTLYTTEVKLLNDKIDNLTNTLNYLSQRLCMLIERTKITTNTPICESLRN